MWTQEKEQILRLLTKTVDKAEVDQYYSGQIEGDGDTSERACWWENKLTGERLFFKPYLNITDTSRLGKLRRWQNLLVDEKIQSEPGWETL